MWTVDIPGFKKLTIDHLVFDFNGTLAINGKLISGIKKRLQELAKQFKVHVITADTFGQAASELNGLPVTLNIIQGNEQAKVKQQFIESLGKETVIAFGNGRNDRLMLETAAVGILVLQQEGSSAASLLSSDVISQNILDATDLLLNPMKLKATLRD